MITYEALSCFMERKIYLKPESRQSFAEALGLVLEIREPFQIGAGECVSLGDPCFLLGREQVALPNFLMDVTQKSLSLSSCVDHRAEEPIGFIDSLG